MLCLLKAIGNTGAEVGSILPFALKLLKQDSGLWTRWYPGTATCGIVRNLSSLQCICIRGLVLDICFLGAWAATLVL